jgi:hypothetical protein
MTSMIRAAKRLGAALPGSPRRRPRAILIHIESGGGESIDAHNSFRSAIDVGILSRLEGSGLSPISGAAMSEVSVRPFPSDQDLIEMAAGAPTGFLKQAPDFVAGFALCWRGRRSSSPSQAVSGRIFETGTGRCVSWIPPGSPIDFDQQLSDHGSKSSARSAAGRRIGAHIGALLLERLGEFPAIEPRARRHRAFAAAQIVRPVPEGPRKCMMDAA